jgi:chromosome segregation ATPase
MSFRIGKAGLHAPYLLLSVAQTNGLAPAIAVRINSRTLHRFLLLKAASSPQEPHLYWAQPLGLDQLLDHIKANSTLRLQVELVPGSPPVQWSVSLRGSSRAMQSQDRCVGQADPRAEAFFKHLREATPSTAKPPAGLTADSLFQFVQTSFASFIQRRATEKRLAQLSQQMEPLRSDEAKFATDLETAQRRLDRSSLALTQTRNELAARAAARTTASTRLTQIQADQAAADQELQKKRAAYDPLAQQLVPLERAASSARQRLRGIRSDLQSEREQVSRMESEIQSLEQDARDLESRILPQLRRDESQAESDLRRASTDLSQFSPHLEKNRILQNDFAYQNATRRLNSEESDLRQSEFEDSTAQSQLRQAEAQLAQCRSQQNADCATAESLAQNARSQVAQTSQRVQVARNRVSSTRSEIQRREFDADQAVWREQQELQNRRNEADRRLRDIEREISRGENRVQDIRSSLIPSLRSQIRSSRAEISRLDQLRAQAESEVATAEAAVSDFKLRTDFSRIESEYQSAMARVESLARDLKQTQTEIARLDRERAALAKTETTQLQDVTKRTATRDSAAQNLRQVQGLLKPLRDQEVIAVSELAQLKTQLEDLSAIIQKGVSKLIPA